MNRIFILFFIALMFGCNSNQDNLPLENENSSTDSDSPLDINIFAENNIEQDDSNHPAQPDIDDDSDTDVETDSDVKVGADVETVADADINSDKDLPIWFLHITDTHIENAEDGPYKALERFVKVVIPTINPTATLNTGDITEKGTESMYKLYFEIVNGNVPDYPKFIEIVGNHDMKEDGNYGEFYPEYSLTGRAGAGFYGKTFIDTSTGKIRIIRTNTSESTNNQLNISGVFKESQKNEIFAMPDDSEDILFSIVMSHHPFDDQIYGLKFGSETRMKELVNKFDAKIYLCGHTHKTDESWVDDTLVVMTDTLKPEEESTVGSFSIVAVDSGIASMTTVNIETDASKSAVEWPLVMITSPSDTSLGGNNPASKKLVAGEKVQIRSLAFSPTEIKSVDYRFNDGNWQGMNEISLNVWEAPFTLPDTTGNKTVEVRAVSQEGVATKTVTLNI